MLFSRCMSFSFLSYYPLLPRSPRPPILEIKKEVFSFSFLIKNILSASLVVEQNHRVLTPILIHIIILSSYFIFIIRSPHPCFLIQINSTLGVAFFFCFIKENTGRFFLFSRLVFLLSSFLSHLSFFLRIYLRALFRLRTRPRTFWRAG